jgi:hypothetical protein
MDQSGFLIVQFPRHIPGQAEIRILIYSTRDQTGNVCTLTEYMGKRVGKGRSCLHGNKRYFPNRRGIVETKSCFGLVGSYTFGNAYDIMIELATDMILIITHRKHINQMDVPNVI